MAALETQYTGGARTDGLLLETAAGVEWSCPGPQGKRVCCGRQSQRRELPQSCGAKLISEPRMSATEVPDFGITLLDFGFT